MSADIIARGLAAKALISSFTWAAKPSAASNAGRIIRVTDAGVGGSLWASDGTNWNSLGPITLAQSAIPKIIVSSGTMGNNGALSGIAAVSVAHPNAFVYLPASAISAGSAAGWYYAVFSSTTAATVYNNTYVSGDAAIPASPTAFATTGPGAFTQAVTEIACATITIPGGTMGANGSAEMLEEWTLTNSANNKTFKMSLAGSILQWVIVTTQNVYRSMGQFANRGAVTSQRSLYSSGTTDTSGGLGIRGGSESYRTAAVDTSADQSITITAQLALASETITLDGYTVKLFPKA